MLKKINAIKKAVECECYLPALALALTLPDICGQIEHPEYKNKDGKRLVGKQYRTWFDEWVKQRYSDSPESSYFTGDMCYDLRCSFLHSGNFDIKYFGEDEDEENKYSYIFELCVNGCDCIGESWEGPQQNTDKVYKTKKIRIDIIKLCRNLYLSAEEYYMYKPEDLFYEHNIRIVDIKKEYEKIIDMNK